jgi:hypothetical protein
MPAFTDCPLSGGISRSRTGKNNSPLEKAKAAAQIQKVSAQLELSKAAPQTVLNNQ